GGALVGKRIDCDDHGLRVNFAAETEKTTHVGDFACTGWTDGRRPVDGYRYLTRLFRRPTLQA
ncbi:hypothetical protein ABTI09_19750, partial [Acinetobacter baumannii]